MENKAKGKKFDAAQKHFEGKKIELEKQIKALTARVSEQNKTISEQRGQIDALSSENQQLKEWIERLLEYTELSKEDIKAACEKDKKIASAMSVFGLFGGGFGGF